MAVLDDYGMYMTYGEAVNATRCARNITFRKASLKAASSPATCPKDEVITYEDVTLPLNRLGDQLRAEQYRHFRGETWLEEIWCA